MQRIGGNAGGLGRRFKSDRLPTAASGGGGGGAGSVTKGSRLAQPAGGVGRRLGAQGLQLAKEEGTVGHVVLGRSVARRESLRAWDPGARRACPQRAAPTARRRRC